MSKIKLMSDNLANKIAAGEVVEKTMNVVKELVENSIDAESDEIKIELIDSGIKQIRVSDNGIGMDKEDAKLAFSRHATSKLLDIEDLFNINSLGFRGEALPSIASVSHVILKTSNKKESTLIELSAGKIEKVAPYSAIDGTSITISDLFYNTPVRLKYVKNLYTELAYITDYIDKMALAYPNIKFELYNNNKLLLATDGSGNLLKVIYEVYGADICKKMVEISSSNDDYNISGYISYPEVYKSNRNAITTLVNGRIIKNNELNKAIIEAYHTYIPKDKFPIVVLNIDVDPILIDVNIHPTKMDIKFSKMKQLQELIVDSIDKTLKKLVLIPNVAVRDYEKIDDTLLIDINPKVVGDVSIDKEYEEISFDLDYTVNDQKEVYQEKKIPKLEPIGIVLSTYIVAQGEDGMYIIDQHAAAERINYEKYLNSMKQNSNECIDPLIPISIELSKNEVLVVKNNKDILTEYGIIIEEFGGNTIIVRSHPIWLKEGYEKESIKKILEIIALHEEFSKDKFIEKVAITLACRMSIKANDYISMEDIDYLIEKLFACDNPYNCPHGRPTIITHTKYDLEKMFKRAIN